MIKNKSIHIRISEDKLKTLRKLAEIDRRKISAVIDFAIERYLKVRKV
jgi:predicted transcriptional regulator